MMRSTTTLRLAGLSIITTLLFAAGCDNQPENEPSVQQEPTATAKFGGHTHSHDEPGPHGGQILDTIPSGVHVEWTHDDATHLFTLYLEDFDEDKLVGAKFVAKSGESEETYALENGENGWSTTSEALLDHLDSGSEVVVIVTDDAGDHTAAIKHHHPHD